MIEYNESIRKHLITKVPIIKEIGCRYPLYYNLEGFQNKDEDPILCINNLQEIYEIFWHSWNQWTLDKRQEYMILLLRKDSETQKHGLLRVLGLSLEQKGNDKYVPELNYNEIIDYTDDYGATHLAIARNQFSSFGHELKPSKRDLERHFSLLKSLRKRLIIIENLIITTERDSYYSFVQAGIPMSC